VNDFFFINFLTVANINTFSDREQTPTFSSSIENLAPSDEVLHLRRQVAKLNRRVLSIELDNLQQQQREKIVYCLGLAYFLLKAIVWLNKK
jgi:mitochondrial fission factor